VVDADFVKAHLGTPAFAIVDARLPAFYDGSRTGGRAPAEHKTGHVAGALSAPFDSFISADVELKPADEIAAVFTKAGVKPGDTVIGYCHIGQQATAMLFAARTLATRSCSTTARSRTGRSGIFRSTARRNSREVNGRPMGRCLPFLAPGQRADRVVSGRLRASDRRKQHERGEER